MDDIPGWASGIDGLSGQTFAQCRVCGERVYKSSFEKGVQFQARLRQHEHKKQISEIKDPRRIVIDDRAANIAVTDEYLSITLRDGRIISQPTWWTPALLTATAEQRTKFEMLGGGVAVQWTEVDADVLVSLMLFPRGSTGCTCGDGKKS